MRSLRSHKTASTACPPHSQDYVAARPLLFRAARQVSRASLFGSSRNEVMRVLQTIALQVGAEMSPRLERCRSSLSAIRLFRCERLQERRFRFSEGLGLPLESEGHLTLARRRAPLPSFVLKLPQNSRTT